MGGFMQAIAICMSANACISCASIATRLLIVEFFWMDALARLSSDKAIRRPCFSSYATLAPTVDSPAIIQLVSCILAKAAVQCTFQLGQV
jgi:hypothetical protein